METAPRSIAAANRLPEAAKEKLYGSIFPPALLERFHIHPSKFCDDHGNSLLTLNGSAASASVEIDLRPSPGFPDPLVYAHLADTMNNQIIVLLFVVNDPASPRFDVDRLPDGTKTQFGTLVRNVPAEMAAMEAGLAPGQVRRGLRILKDAICAFEGFISAFGREMYFVEPLTYHNAIAFERYGFAYQQGKRWMESLNTRFAPGGDIVARLDGSTPFRRPGAERSIRGRSWAIHDGILGEPYTGVHMYKMAGKMAGVATYPDAVW
ncbi:MAG: hypothetical protein HY023_10885 [Chloroflexi bacterium]|nr:hypothetical protein [Chloroflexota bacterium]